jgi:hypothetical protein
MPSRLYNTLSEGHALRVSLVKPGAYLSTSYFLIRFQRHLMGKRTWGSLRVFHQPSFDR